MNKTGLRNIKLLIGYDGTSFSGWQRQKAPEGSGAPPTIQGTIEAALARIHKHPVHLTGSGRTDAGVHAAGQIANFYTSIAAMEAERFIPALNSLLPREIRILDAQETTIDFHARFDAKLRVYRYHFICGRSALPQELRYGLQLWHRPRLDLLNGYARLLRGELDCSLFALSREPSESLQRYIAGACFYPQEDRLIFEIGANAFLWKMVRSIAGTLLYYEEQGVDAEDFRAVLHSADRRLAGPTLPPQGLCLWKIDYYRGL